MKTYQTINLEQLLNIDCDSKITIAYNNALNNPYNGETLIKLP